MIDATTNSDSLDTPNQDHDSPWKEILEQRFGDFLALLFPHIHREVDWSRPPEFLDTELQQITQDSQLGRRYADKLVRVWTKDNRAIFVLIHLEVQGDPDQDFSLRMYVYNYRIFDKHKVDVVSLGVLADASPSFRPSSYQRQRWGCELDFRFPMVKLLDWKDRWEELENSDNVFSLVVMAQIKAKTIKNTDELRAWKLHLIRLMYDRGYTRETILQLFRIIDWMIRLPESAEKEFWTEYSKIEEEKKMPYITSVERIGIEKGQIEGRKEGLKEGRYSALLDLVHNAKEQGVSDDLIARLTGLDIQSVHRIWNNEPIDIPPHLLKSVSSSKTTGEMR
ncbi:Rpn family recombination-promoting nuclease/putative transposase [Desulfonatronum parangueonense]